MPPSPRVSEDQAFENWIRSRSATVSSPISALVDNSPACVGEGRVLGCVVSPSEDTLALPWRSIRALGVPEEHISNLPVIHLCHNCKLLYISSQYGYRTKDQWVRSVATTIHRSPNTVRAGYSCAAEVLAELTSPHREAAFDRLAELTDRLVEIIWYLGEQLPESLRQIEPEYQLSWLDVSKLAEGYVTMKLIKAPVL